MKVLLDCRTPEGSYRFEGIPNKRGFLGKIVIDQLRADHFKDAELRAFRALSSGLSNITVYLDIPLHIYQVDVTELATGTASMSLATPWMETPLFALPVDSMSPDFRFYASLYREAAGSNSPGYQFLCYYKIIEGVRVRHERSIVEARKQGLPIPSAPREFVPSTREDQVAWLNGLFPVRQAWDSLALDMVFPKEALGRKLNDVIDKELDGIRNRLAHAVLRSGEATVLIDDGHDRLVLSTWLALTKCIARALLRDEFPDVFLSEAKGPPAPPSARGSSTPAFTSLPE